MRGLSQLAPYPAPLPLPPAHDRHDPAPAQTAAAMWALVRQRDWARLAWPDLLESLVALGRADVPLSRLVEGHVDALRILSEAGRGPQPGCLYAVWASRSHATGIRACPADHGWRLSGTLRFASGAGVVDRALVPVWVAADEHVLLDLDVTKWPVDELAWRTTAMAVSRSHTIRLDDVEAPRTGAVGDTGFYLGRQGFFPGGVGVAAVWAGGAARLADLVADYCSGAPWSPSRSVRLGLVRTDLAAAHAVLNRAGVVLQDGATGVDLRALATETRAAVASCVRRVVEQVRCVAGPAGLAHALDLTRAVDDLDLYVRQQNSDADAEYLGDPPR